MEEERKLFMGNPRYKNGAKRRELRRYFKHRGEPCALCGKPIDYSLPAGHPMSFEIDEIIPVSKGGDPFSKQNTQAAHRICNQRKGNKLIRQGKAKAANLPIPKSREW